MFSGSFSLVHWIVLALVVLVLFGRGRISEVMGDFGKGIKSFKEGMNDGASTPIVPPATQIPPPVVTPPVEAATPVAPVPPPGQAAQ